MSVREARTTSDSTFAWIMPTMLQMAVLGLRLAQRVVLGAI